MIDLDQLIRDADPARGLEPPAGDPAAITRGVRPRRRLAGLAGPSGVAVAAGVAIAVALIVLTVGVRPHGRPGAMPAHLPLGNTLRPPGPTGVIPGTPRIRATFPDPAGGPAWALRTYETRSHMTCLQVGRTQSGMVGAIGFDGAYGDDGRFHPFALSDVGLGQCVPEDARGHAFVNISWPQGPAAAGHEECQRASATAAAGCPASALRAVFFGLLGPDAVRVTYTTDSGRQMTVPTRGPDGAYLVVRKKIPASCNRPVPRTVTGPTVCGLGSGVQIGPGAGSGEITAIAYRDGHVCRLPVPQGAVVRVAQCPVVGYARPPGPSYREAQVAAPVTVRELPARYYCDRPGVYRPAALPIPCDGAVPPGYARRTFTPPRPGHPGTDPGQNLLVYVSWTARAPVRDTNVSTYNFTLAYPRGCGMGGEGSSTQARLRAGQRVTRYFFVPTRCRGAYAGAVGYVPDLGPGGPQSPLMGMSTSGRGVLLVGRFSFTLR